METFQSSRPLKNAFIVAILLVLVLATAGIDFIYSRLHNTSYYISESLLFSSFWYWFVPLLTIQFRLINGDKSLLFKISLTLFIWALHLAIYPASVWAISYLFFSHTFSYISTFYFGVTEYALKSALVYTLAIPIFLLIKNKTRKTFKTLPIEFITLTENNTTFNLDTKEIVYFSANSPYVTVHLLTKKYLHTETLKGLQDKLDPARFIRIHKSHMVNLMHVSSYQSRLNGDYDLTLSDGSLLRVSRNYAPTFKEAFKRSHRLSTE